MSYQPSINPLLREFLPTDFTAEQGVILSARNAANWLECAAITTYPLELRAAWRQRGKEWLDLAFVVRKPGFSFTSLEHEWTLNDDIDRADKFWALTESLGSLCRSHASE